MFLEKIKYLPPAVFFLVLAIGSAAISFLGMALQSFYQLNPCPYCIFQRVLYFTIAAIAFLTFLLSGFPKVWKTLAFLTIFIALGGAVLAAYQSVMQFFPGILPECGFSEPNIIEQFVDFLGLRWPEWFLATGFCSSIKWAMFGLSMANWSFLCFLAIALYVAFVLFNAQRYF